MKLYFEPNLDYQHSAIESVCDLFRGQEICRTEFTVTRDATAAQQTLAFAQSDLGIGNRQQLLDDEILANLTNIQVRNGLRPSASLASGDFTVEMETGSLPLSRVLQRCELSELEPRERIQGGAQVGSRAGLSSKLLCQRAKQGANPWRLRIGHLEQSFKAAVRRDQGQGLLNGSFRRQLTGLVALS